MITPTTTTLTPSDIMSRIQWILEALPDLKSFWIKGEISNLKHYQKGNQLYFNLCDNQSQINCVLYSTALQRLKFSPKNGQLIHAKGQLKVYRKKGTINIQIVAMQPLQKGPLAEQLNKLKTKLEQEGLFNPSTKHPIAQYHTHIGLITSANSAAQHDICQLLKQNSPHINISIFPSVMQGFDTVPSVKKAINYLKKIPFIDSIVIARGGGSSEELHAFNNESLVRLIATVKKPIITAIGHQTDTTLCDLVADLQCETPSAAAARIYQPYQQLNSHIINQLQTIKNKLNYTLYSNKIQLQYQLKDLKKTINSRLMNETTEFKNQLNNLKLQNPLRLIDKGYSHCQTFNGNPLNSIKQVKKNDPITIHIKDGIIQAIVKNKYIQQ